MLHRTIVPPLPAVINDMYEYRASTKSACLHFAKEHGLGFRVNNGRAFNLYRSTADLRSFSSQAHLPLKRILYAGIELSCYCCVSHLLQRSKRGLGEEWRQRDAGVASYSCSCSCCCRLLHCRLMIPIITFGDFDVDYKMTKSKHPCTQDAQKMHTRKPKTSLLYLFQLQQNNAKHV